MQRTPAEEAAARAAAARDRALSAEQKKRGGVVHTPPELARFVARAADALLREELGLPGGLADPELAVIDPACGPGAFLAAAAAVVRERARVAAGSLPVLHGFDRDPEAIAAAAALVPELARDGVRCALTQRDTLREARPAHVAELAPALCVLGNPPWVGGAHEALEPWFAALAESMRHDAYGAPIDERKVGVLADTYVRFARWALEVARCARRGAVIALVTNGSYLDGPVHRGLRGLLLRELDALHVIDLGGNALLARDRAGAQQRDDNVFGVRPSVAIALGVRRGARDADAPPARVRYARLFGSRAGKLAQLGDAELDSLPFAPLAPEPQYVRFVPTRAADRAYASWPSLAEAMPFHREGVQTNRDGFAIEVRRADLIERLRAFAGGAEPGEIALATRPMAHYDPEKARGVLRDAFARDPSAETFIRPIAYRPFDTRWFVALAPICHRPRPELLRAIDAGGLALLSTRKDRGSAPWAHFGAARDVPDNCYLSTRSSCRTRAFPRLTPDGRDNLGEAVARGVAERIGHAIDARAFIAYALAVLANADYRAQHDEWLRIDYPRIPWPRDAAQFERLRAAGERLIALFCDPLTVPHEPASAVDRERSYALRIGHHTPYAELLREASTTGTIGALDPRLAAMQDTIDGLSGETW
jgi:hypothetical protein